MIIVGFNKLTLVDFPTKVACIVFLGGCNFRCPFCHNSTIVEFDSNPTISQQEILDFLKKRKGILEGVVLSGGEPLINNLDEIVDFIKKIRALGYQIKLDTNGSFPHKLDSLLKMNLIDYVAMDIKNSPSNYALATGTPVNLSDINKSIELIRNSGIEYEFRSTLVKDIHSKQDLIDMAQWLKNEKNYFIQAFVNSGGLFNNSLKPLDMQQAVQIMQPLIPNIKVR